MAFNKAGIQVPPSHAAAAAGSRSTASRPYRQAVLPPISKPQASRV